MHEQALSVREAIIGRRSVKNFNGQPVDIDNINSILEDARWAPTHGLRNPWRFIVAANKEYVKFQDVLKEYGVPKWKELSEEELEKQMKKFSGAGAVVFVVVPEDSAKRNG